MKKLIIINGTMGVGKSAVCRHLLNMLTPGAGGNQNQIFSAQLIKCD